jgi:cell division inhibitor SulA
MRQLLLGMEEAGLSLSSQQPGRMTRVSTSALRGSLTEVIVSEGGAIQPMHLLPMLAQCNAHKRWLMWLSPHRPMNKSWLESMGLQHSPVIHLDLCNDTQLALCSKVLAAGNSHMIVEWQGELSNHERQIIRQQADQSGSHVVLIQRRP